MPAPVIDPLPSAPSRGSESREQFVLTTDAFLGALGPFVTQTNALAEYLDGLSAGAIDWGDIGGTLADQTDLQSALDAKQPLDTQLTALAGLSYAGNALKVVRVTAGENGFELAAAAGGAGDWGDIGGTLADQTDLQSALDLKAPLTAPTFATSITGSYLTASLLLATDGSKNIVSLSAATYPSLAELAYVKGVTSAVQTQLDAKLASASYTAADVLSKLLTVDGAGSGLDADLLDGNSSAAFALAGHSHAAFANVSGTKAELDSAVTDGNICYDGDAATNLTMATARFLARTTASTGAVEELTFSQVKAALDLEIGTDVQAYSAVLDNTTASFTTADETKLDGIEAAADVTDETNVKAALDGMVTTGVTPASGDKILLLDVSDSDNLKHAVFSDFGGGGTPGGSSGQIQYNNASALDGSILWQGTNLIEQRNSTNSQSFRIYDTWTDASNNSYGGFNWTGSTLRIDTAKNGTGTARDLVLGAKGTTHFTLNGTNIYVATGISPNITGARSFGENSLGWGQFWLGERATDPANPAEGHSVIWHSDGTAAGDDGDIMIKITAGGVTKTGTLVDFSALP